MYCPNCTAEILTGHRYCRGCGVDLREISQAIGGAKPLETRTRSEEAQPAQTVSTGLKQWCWGFYFGILGLVFVWELRTGVGPDPACNMPDGFFLFCAGLRREPRPAA